MDGESKTGPRAKFEEKVEAASASAAYEMRWERTRTVSSPTHTRAQAHTRTNKPTNTQSALSL